VGIDRQKLTNLPKLTFDLDWKGLAWTTGAAHARSLLLISYLPTQSPTFQCRLQGVACSVYGFWCHARPFELQSEVEI
jgi:hypothetical protein